MRGFRGARHKEKRRMKRERMTRIELDDGRTGSWFGLGIGFEFELKPIRLDSN